MHVVSVSAETAKGIKEIEKIVKTPLTDMFDINVKIYLAREFFITGFRIVTVQPYIVIILKM